jgi:mRNA interferase MazF
MKNPRRGEIYWTDLGETLGSRPSLRRPVLVVQDNLYNDTRLATVIVLTLTTNQKLAGMQGNVLIAAHEAGLPRDSVANVTQLYIVNKLELSELVGQLPEWLMALVDDGLKLVLGLKR